MLGFDTSGHKLKCKAAEARSMLGFAVELAREFRVQMGQFLLDAGLHLQQIYELFRLQQRAMGLPERIQVQTCISPPTVV